FVAKVENPTTPKISRKSIPIHRCRCEAPRRRYESPWSFWRETIWSLTSRGARRISGSENFDSHHPKNTFATKSARIRLQPMPCLMSAWGGQQRKVAVLLDHLVGAGEQRGRDVEVQRLGRPEVDD